uniref:MY15B protein n=1 Tax=Junco hyemalis TaxID=40217 RepID=A0A8C5IW88_JUNHY
RGAGQQELLCELLVSCHPTRPPSLAGRHQAQANQITETQPPEVKVKDDLSLPPTINSHPFSSFIKSHFQVGTLFLPSLPPLWLQFSLSCPGPFQILRFIGDQSLHGWQEVLLGNFIAGRGLRDAALRDEIFSQVVAQSWRNPDTERGRRGWLLMATLLSCFGPSPALQKPLLKFVSDYGMEGYSAVCQRKMLRAAQCMGTGPAPARAYPPTQLEWTANQRRGKMVLDVHTFNEEEFSAEVESWMTGEQYAAWILSDLLGCDFVLDLIGEMEDTTTCSSCPTTHGPATHLAALWYPGPCLPPTQPPSRACFPAYSLPLLSSDTHLNVFPSGKSVPLGSDNCFGFILMQDMENSENLTRRMKGGGKIGPTQRGIFPSTGLSGMTQTPVYQPMPSMVGMPAAMPMMPGVGGVAPMPAMVMPQPMVPAVDPSQLAAQQQAFINQQAMLMAQQMTLQAMTISQQQQQQELQKQQKSLENSRPRASSPAQASAPATLPKPKKPPSSQAAAAPSRSPEDFSCVFAGLLIKALIPTAPASPMPPPEPKPKKETPKPKKEPPVVKPSGPEKRPAPSHEIGNIIKMYQSRPAPEPQPIQPSRKVSKPFIKKNDPKNEALAKLGMMNPSPQRSKKIPPPVKPKPGPASSSIKEKQLPLLSIFKPEGAPPAAQAPYAPPLPPATPEDQGRQEPPGKGEYLFHPCGIWSYLCNICNTTIALLLQVFYPKENFSHPYCLNLLCEQVISAPLGVRASQSRQRNIPWVSTEEGIKKRIVVAARDNWANYFSRLFPVQGEKGSDVQLLGVSHRGMRLLKVEKAAGYHPEHLKILRSYCFAEVLSVEMKGSNSLEFSLKTEQLILHSPKAPCIKDMVELFMQELRQDTNYVVALRSYIVDDKSLLSFNKGDLIELLPMQGVEPGWQFGSMGGRCGLFPTSLVQLAPAIDYLSSSMDRRGEQRKGTRAPPESRNTSREVSSPWGETPRAHEVFRRAQAHLELLRAACIVPRCPQSFLIHRESELRGWLLLNLLTGYFLPSKILMPYATKFLQLASSDPSSAHHGKTVCVLGVGFCVPLEWPMVGTEVGRGELRWAGRLQFQPLPQEGWMTLSLCHAGKMVRPMKLEEYLHDYLLEDVLVTVTLRRLIWRTPLHFDNQVYTDVHYGQVSKSRTLPSRDRGGVPASRNVPKGWKSRRALADRLSLTTPGWCSKLLAESCCPQATFCCLLEHVMRLPFFGYSIFTVERISDVFSLWALLLSVAVPWQAVSRVVALRELQRMRTLRPLSDGGPPGLELHYGSPDSPRALWLELPQVRSAWACSRTFWFLSNWPSLSLR